MRSITSITVESESFLAIKSEEEEVKKYIFYCNVSSFPEA
jgi:hypothetical protein